MVVVVADDGSSRQQNFWSNFRSVTAHTTVDDIRREYEPQLEPNLVDKEYEDCDHYLSTQFGLLREELVRPLVDDVNRLRQVLIDYQTEQDLENSGQQDSQQQEDGQQPQHRRVFKKKKKTLREVIDSHPDIVSNVYFFIKPVKVVVHNRYGPTIDFSFDYSHLESVNLQDFQPLLEGNLMCLSCDKFNNSLVFGVIVKSRLNEPAERNSNEIIWEFSLKVDLDELQCQQLFEFALKPNLEYIGVESLTYFEGMTHTLTKLQKLITVPFEEYLVKLKRKIIEPKYLNNESFYDMSCIAPENNDAVNGLNGEVDDTKDPLKSVKLIDSNHKLLAKNASIFDGQQFEAFYAAITKEFAITQGPPGTGKTFVGLKLVKCLLDNENVRNPTDNRRPILIVCYKNHALDQFLEGILKFNQNVVRIGGKSESKELEEFKLFNIMDKFRKQKKKPFNLRPKFYPLVFKQNIKCLKRQKRLSNLKSEMENIFKMIKKSFSLILDYNVIDPFIRPKNNIFTAYFDRLSREIGDEEENPIKHWLFGKTSVIDWTKLKQKRLSSTKLYDIIEDWVRDVYSMNDISTKFDDIIGSNDNQSDNQTEESLIESQVNKRWKLYLYWRELFFDHMKKRCNNIWETLSEEITEYQSKYCKLQRLLCSEAQVIGCTITGAAKYSQLIDMFDPQIMIVEEAAEVLEGHIVAAMPSNIEHIILVGDHKQLRPITNVRELTTEYKMDISLFERMVTMNMPYQQLQQQFRMRPCIAELLKVANFYDIKLTNAQKVTVYPNINYTFGKNMYFIDHKHIEDNTHSRQSHDRSRSNLHEAKMIVEFVKYLLLRGYSGDDITVLATYNSQLSEIKHLMFEQEEVFVVKKELVDECNPLFSQTNEPPKLKVRVSSVDGFQGEENNIVVISFVRSSKMGSIGFLQNENRVNVALSRARHALYCVGNFENMSQESDMWRKIVKHLNENNYLGQVFTIGCKCTDEVEIEMPGQLALFNLQLKNGRCRCHTIAV
ncbi:NFX1-type zinc finger-containing protein 1-like [Oppia nitens]|uniref:NFX1-type zinc finger-containing protein 1-like n=1 Tax=Oppia nitens TaxID=1686743 RepID=UPI0023DC36A2|nr:NFX1-type zinc finger-containing protein 1-like [Oppia nitens]